MRVTSGKLGIDIYKDEQGRAVVHRVPSWSPLSRFIFPGEVIVAVDGVPADCDGIFAAITTRQGSDRNLHLVRT